MVVIDVGVGGTVQDSHSIESQHCTHYRRGVTNIIQLEAESNWFKVGHIWLLDSICISVTVSYFL